ncbi:MAG: hypothetical protein EP298_10050 [Gammaproteobacteria bacterium]|nr:MAG: hypothetical protein EP298_10050 [Gammaproteobacteria bacterium]UTW41576.1 hypothetical protein KFE69_08655 [bacterium SCSIO 12844]
MPNRTQQLKQALVHKILDKYQNKGENLFYLNQKNTRFDGKSYTNVPNYVIEHVELAIREDKQYFKQNQEYAAYDSFHQYLLNNIAKAQYEYETTLSGSISTCLLDNSSSPIQDIIQSGAENLQSQLRNRFPNLNDEHKKAVLVMQLLVDAQLKTNCFFAHNRKDIEHEGKLFKNIPGPIVDAVKASKAINESYQNDPQKQPLSYRDFRAILSDRLSCFEDNESFYNTHLESNWAANLYRNPEPIFQSYEPPKQTTESELYF